jgi:hypothetical protein
MRAIVRLPVVLLLSISLLGKGESSNVSEDGETSLFDWHDESITQINSSTFDEQILNQPTLSVLIVYSLHCGPCHNYAPVYSNLAQHVSGWRHFVRLYVLRCDQNVRFCSNLKFTGTPSTKIYPPYTQNRLGGLARPTHYSLDEFENMILTDLKSTVRPSLPSDALEALNPLPVDRQDSRSSLIELVQSKSTAPITLVMLEETPCLTAEKLVLDFWPFLDRLQILIVEEIGQKWSDLLIDDDRVFLPALFQLSDDRLELLER